MLSIFNSLTGQKEPFKPIHEGKVNLYVCGMTVYDYCHIGHARVLVSFDVIVRYLKMKGFDVTYVRNITDIDDKIIQRALQNQESVEDLTQRFIEAMHEDEASLNILSPSKEPRATHHIDQIIDMIQTLIARGHAYQGENGDVYFEVGTFDAYGQLSHKDIEALRAGERVEVVESKRSPLDFVLWKQAKPNEPHWNSPWGPGRPGWHIECSAMSTHCLGNTFDIHGGGFDLQFPHHENEVAQSECATGESFVKYWMHVGFVQVNKEKMSKSLGNFFTIRDVLQKYTGEVVRYFLISSHYRSPLNYTEQNLEAARASLSRLYTSIRGLPEALPIQHSEAEQRFCEAMDDDFNTAEALAILFELAREINKHRETDLMSAAQHAATLRHLAGIIGLLQEDPEIFLHGGLDQAPEANKEIELLIAARDEARNNRDWATADRIRDELTAQGIELEDGPQGTIWHRK